MDINATIKDLEKQKANIETAIASLRALNGSAPSERKQGKGKLTILGTALGHLRRTGGTVTTLELKNAVVAAGVNFSESSFQSILSRRARLKKDLLHTGRGKWRLKA